jgi:hypothetical protein
MGNYPSRPSDTKTIRGKRYFRSVWGLTKQAALRKASDWRTVGYKASVVSQGDGYYAVYMRKPDGSR